MMNQAEKYSILVVDSDVGFLERLTTILKQIAKNYEAFIFSESDCKNINKIIQNRKIDIAFLDERAYTNERLLSNLYVENPNCLVILMISNYGGKNIREVIKTFKNHNQIFMGEYLLKDNYSENILKVLCRKYLEKVKCEREINNLSNE